MVERSGRVLSYVAGVAASLLLLAGCAADQPLSAPGTGDDPSFEAGGAHQMPMYGEADPESFDTAAASATKLRYYGGHVIPHAKVVVVYWGSNVDATTQSKIGGFYSAVLDSPYMDWLSEYDTDIAAVGGQAGTNQHIGRGSYAGAVTIHPSKTSGTIDDTQIQSELNKQINGGALPAPDANTVYMTYFPKGMAITQGGSQSCVQFCAYHGTFKRSGKSTFYGVMPDMSAGSGCDQGCGNASSSFANLTSASSHELIEAVTDAEVGLATTQGPPLAWYDPNNGEIGDICASYDGTVAGYNVQKEWDNATSKCILSKGTSTANDFSVSLSPASATAAPGTSVQVAVHTAVVSGQAQSVSLSVSGLPSGVTASVSPSTVSAGSQSALMLTVGNSAAPGTYTYSVKGAASSGSHTVSGTLTVSGGTTSSDIANGGFEGSLGGWTLGGVKHPIDSTAEHHSGSDALRAGATTTTEPNGDSWAYQEVAIPSGASSATLTFWYCARSTDTVSHDWQEALVRSTSGATLKSIFHQASNARTWTKETVDVSAWRGKTIQVYFNVHEDGGTTPTSMWVDDVSLSVN